MNTTLNSLPIVKCPHCGKIFQWDDYCEIKSGDSRDCPKCEKEIHVLFVDTVINAELGIKPLARCTH